MTIVEDAPKPKPALPDLDRAVRSGRQALLSRQRPDGHWVFELEADATIPAEYVLLRHYRGEPEDAGLEARIATYLRRIQGSHGGWPLFEGGALDISASVKAYFALKMIGDAPDLPHMKRAREAILAAGGAARSNVFTRILLALYRVVPWRAVPVMPAEIMLLPRWFPFHLTKISYWARTVIVPLLILQALKPAARNPRGVGIDELFLVPPDKVRHWPKGPHQKAPYSQIFGGIDRVLRLAEPFFPGASRKRSIDKAVAFVTERLNGEDGLGAIYPAMANAVMAFDALGYPADHPALVVARRSIEKLLVHRETETYCQPCVSPVWDTALVCHALLESGEDARAPEVHRGLAWLKPRQVLDVKGDWAELRPDVRPGGWAFQYANDHYPDLDDTAVVVMAMDRAQSAAGHEEFAGAIARGREWIEGLQSRNGGWGAFDADNDYDYLNHIPFSDHGALLDPPTADVTGRCLSMLGQLGATAKTSAAVARALDYLWRTQEKDGSWYGRWGVNYVYGTWSVLCGLNAVGVDPASPPVRRAVDWLIAIQNEDGGWGEDCASYKLDYAGYEKAASAASQTAWAVLGLMAAGEANHPAVTTGVQWLLDRQEGDGLWPEEAYTGTGFPRVFYLRYHGYAKFFPLWAVSRYRTLMKGNGVAVLHGM
ncbi:squalene--hopene cyclase [Labrys monachus]|uniref:Squalene-hopene/tetraprenyl-beta-curcumene cyclase n=1 Tax=Labrys monachus TaxID=217067 RepID=A0ABU0FCV1_9HYPH|nr:squalene--hopene cyclase [Labrys monachus]MDQ0391964.1 squalene-hopene/tetraprenyl-beta-curcumene cyclase [Labrys monachus]